MSEWYRSDGASFAEEGKLCVTRSEVIKQRERPQQFTEGPMDTETSKLSSGNTAFEFGASKGWFRPKGKRPAPAAQGICFHSAGGQNGNWNCEEQQDITYQLNSLVVRYHLISKS